MHSSHEENNNTQDIVKFADLFSLDYLKMPDRDSPATAAVDLGSSRVPNSSLRNATSDGWRLAIVGPKGGVLMQLALLHRINGAKVSNAAFILKTRHDGNSLFVKRRAL